MWTSGWARTPSPGSRVYTPPSPPPPEGQYEWLEFRDPVTYAFVMNYVLHSPPSGLPGQRTLGLVMLFHGVNSSQASELKFIIPFLERQGWIDDYVVIGGKSQGNGWGSADDVPVRKILEWATGASPVDPRRVFVHGFSSGGMMTGRWGPVNQDIIAGGVPKAGRFDTIPSVADALNMAAEWYIIHGDKDQAVSVNNSRNGAAELASKGYRYVYRELDGEDHVGIRAWEAKEHLEWVYEDAMAWKHFLRHKDKGLFDEDATFLTGLGGLTPAQIWRNAATVDDLVRIGGNEASSIVVDGLQATEEDVRIEAALACGRVWLNETSDQALAALLDDSSATVRA